MLHKNHCEDTGGVFPSPTSYETLDEYLKWDDWKVVGEISLGTCGEHGEFIKERNHHRCVWNTTEVASDENLQLLENYKSILGNLVAFVGDASKSLVLR